MASNIEIKATAPDLHALRGRAEDLGAKLAGTLVQTDTFYVCPHGRLKLRQFAEGEAELIAYERADTKGLRHSSYERVPMPADQELHRALERSLGVRAVVRKRRELWLIGTTRIHLDRVEGLGDFVEIEVVLAEGQTHSQGESEGQRLMQGLGILPEHELAVAYVDLLEGKQTAQPSTSS